MMNTLTSTIERIGEGFDAFKQANDKNVEQITGRLESLESNMDRPKSGSGNNHHPYEIEHKNLFESWLRDPFGNQQKAALAEAEGELFKQKAIAIGTGSSGGYAVPALIATEIESRVNQLNPWRQLVKTVTVGSSSYSHLVSKNASGYGWVGEGGSRSETDTSELIQCAPTFGYIYSYPKASEESMEDIFFDVGKWLVEEVADGFAAGEATAIWSGDGSNKPSGIINTTPAATSDGSSPERALTALQYLPLGAFTSPETLTIDSLINLAYSPKEAYLLGDSVAWVMRRSTAAIVRKLKDDNGAYHWQPATMAGQPDTLLGYPVYLSDSVDAATANNFPIAFGNWARAYLFAVRQDIRITVDDNITTPGQVKFYCRRRVGGKVLNNEAARLLKYAAS